MKLLNMLNMNGLENNKMMNVSFPFPGLLTIAFVVSGAFLDEPILFCGHAMMQRLYAFTGEGITLRQTILWTGITSVTSVIVGARHLSKKDLIR